MTIYLVRKKWFFFTIRDLETSIRFQLEICTHNALTCRFTYYIIMSTVKASNSSLFISIPHKTVIFFPITAKDKDDKIGIDK